MLVRVDGGNGEWTLADLDEVIGVYEPEPPEYDFLGTCPKCLWGRDPIYNPKTNSWEVTN